MSHWPKVAPRELQSPSGWGSVARSLGVTKCTTCLILRLMSMRRCAAAPSQRRTRAVLVVTRAASCDLPLLYPAACPARFARAGVARVWEEGILRSQDVLRTINAPANRPRSTLTACDGPDRFFERVLHPRVTSMAEREADQGSIASALEPCHHSPSGGGRIVRAEAVRAERSGASGVGRRASGVERRE
jgi:hypothetical protein